MIVLAILLLVLVAAVVVLVAVAGMGQTVNLEWDQMNLFWEPNAFVLFLLGALTMLVALLAVGLLMRGSKKQTERRKELKRLREVERQQYEQSHTRTQSQREPVREERPREDTQRDDAQAGIRRREGAQREERQIVLDDADATSPRHRDPDTTQQP